MNSGSLAATVEFVVITTRNIPAYFQQLNLNLKDRFDNMLQKFICWHLHVPPPCFSEAMWLL